MATQKGKANQGDPQKYALLIIDVQRGLFSKPIPVYNADELLDNILDLVDRAHAAGVSVIYIQHCNEKTLIKGSGSWQLHRRLHAEAEDIRLFKENSNAFTETELSDILISRGVEWIVACGLVTHGCVESTCLGGLKEGYQVLLAGDAHSNFSKDAAKLIKKWNKLLADKGVVVEDTADISFQ